MTAKVLSNLESLGDLIGSLKGIEEGLEEDAYMEGLIKQAHGKASNAFNVAAAATASAGHMTHVFEFGTAGITPGPVKYPDPTSASARLWTHTLTGRGGNQDIGYSFRPALNRNPQPTTASTGVESKYLRKLSKRKYIFWNKAFVMETGRTVEIHAKNGDFLFVPFRGEVPRNPLNRKGFVMWNTKKLGPITAVPGQNTKGQFTAFWMSWWSAAGNEIIEQDMRASVMSDIEKAMAEATRRANAAAMETPATTNIVSAVNKAKSWVSKMFGTSRRDVEINE